MDSLATSLVAHQQGPARRPALSLSLLDSRFGAPRLDWQPLRSSDDTTDPIAATQTPDGRLHRITNDRGEPAILVSAIDFPSPDSEWSNWTTLDSTDIHADGYPAITWLPIPGDPFNQEEILLAYITEDAGTYEIVVRSSVDDGATWSAPQTVYSGSQQVDFLALPNHNGLNADTALFFAAAGDDEVWHLRRTSGSWTVSPVNWTRQGTVHHITGLAAAHDGADFMLVVTGSAETTEAPTAWALRCGDLDFTPDAYTALVPIIQLDPASSTVFRNPAIAATSPFPLVAFCWDETGDVASKRYYASHPLAPSVTSATYVQPFPLPGVLEHAALSFSEPTSSLYLLDLGAAWYSPFSPGDSNDLSDAILAAEWSFGPATSRARFTLDSRGGGLEEYDHEEIEAGTDLLLFAGYRSGEGGEAQFGATRRFHVERVETSFNRDGRRTTTLHASGPWEAAARWHSPLTQAFAPSARTREQLFQYVAGRAGIATEGSASDGWDTTSPAFLLPAGETARSALTRLIRPIPGLVNHEAGSFVIQDPPDPGGPNDEHYCYHRGLGYPVLAATRVRQPPPVNWLRLQGPDRYFDDVDDLSVGPHGPLFEVVRLSDATTDGLAEDYANAALARSQLDWPALRLTVPYHAGQRLWDAVSVHFPPLSVDGCYRVIGLENTYTRRPGAGVYETVLTLQYLPGAGPAPSHEEED